MPELPEVEVIRRGLSPMLMGQQLRKVHIATPSLRYPIPTTMESVLRGHQLVDIRRRGKYLLFDFDGMQLLTWHLGMSGQFHLLPHTEAAAKHEHIRLDFFSGISLRYRDPRRFGYVGLLARDCWQMHPWFSTMGPEPLSSGFDSGYLYGVTSQKRASIKAIIMNAKVVVGVGNIYASESLFRARIHPETAGHFLTGIQCQKLTSAIRNTLKEAIKAGGSSISDFVQVDGKPGYFSHAFQVYGRTGERCYCCESTIVRCQLAGRSTFFCPRCQPLRLS